MGLLTTRRLVAALAVLSLAAGCGDDDTDPAQSGDVETDDGGSTDASTTTEPVRDY
jgi:hypothetical protein